MSQAWSRRRSWALIPTPSWRQGQSRPRSPQCLTPLVTASQWKPSGPGDGCMLEKCHLHRLAKKKGGKLLLFSRHLLAFPGTDGYLGSAGDATAELGAVLVARTLQLHLLGGDAALSHAPHWAMVVPFCQMALVMGTGWAAGRGWANMSLVHAAGPAHAARDEVSGSEVVWVPPGHHRQLGGWWQGSLTPWGT